VTISVPPPGIPTNLTATAGDGQAFLKWNAQTNATGYNLKRSLTSGSGYTTIASVLTATNFTDAGLANGLVYYYVVSGTNAVGESANSTEVSVRPVSTSAPALNFNLVGGQLQFNWPADHTGWKLQAQTNAPGSGLGTNWVPFASSSGTNQLWLPIDPMNGSVFFRLVYP
jgi:hypothetical protein